MIIESTQFQFWRDKKPFQKDTHFQFNHNNSYKKKSISPTSYIPFPKKKTNKKKEEKMKWDFSPKYFGLKSQFGILQQLYCIWKSNLHDYIMAMEIVSFKWAKTLFQLPLWVVVWMWLPFQFLKVHITLVAHSA